MHRSCIIYVQKLYNLFLQVSVHYDNYNYSKVLQTVEKFVNSDVSSFYCSMTKDRQVYVIQDTKWWQIYLFIQHSLKTFYRWQILNHLVGKKGFKDLCIFQTTHAGLYINIFFNLSLRTTNQKKYLSDSIFQLSKK